MILTERFGTDEINYSRILTSVSSFGYIKTKPSFSPRSALGAAKSSCDPTSVSMFSCAGWVQPPRAPVAFFTCHSMSLNTSGSSMVGVICRGKARLQTFPKMKQVKPSDSNFRINFYKLRSIFTTLLVRPLAHSAIIRRERSTGARVSKVGKL